MGFLNHLLRRVCLQIACPPACLHTKAYTPFVGPLPPSATLKRRRGRLHRPKFSVATGSDWCTASVNQVEAVAPSAWVRSPCKGRRMVSLPSDPHSETREEHGGIFGSPASIPYLGPYSCWIFSARDSEMRGCAFLAYERSVTGPVEVGGYIWRHSGRSLRSERSDIGTNTRASAEHGTSWRIAAGLDLPLPCISE